METIFFRMTLAICLLAAILFFTKKTLVWLPVLGVVVQLIGIIIYGLRAGRPPFANFYESLLFFSLLIVLLWLLSLLIYPDFKKGGAYLLLLASLGLGYVVLSPSQAKPLMPVLQSYWLHIHVVTCFLSYAFFTLAAVAALVFLLERKEESIFKTVLIFIRVGFLLLTLGIASGSIWAHYAWGRYWGWDPKEVWALITWLYYLLFFHLRLVGAKKKTQAYLAIIGLFVILFTFLGVNFLLSGLHSYL